MHYNSPRLKEFTKLGHRKQSLALPVLICSSVLKCNKKLCGGRLGPKSKGPKGKGSKSKGPKGKVKEPTPNCTIPKMDIPQLEQLKLLDPLTGKVEGLKQPLKYPNSLKESSMDKWKLQGPV
jgi:hypothetical protein